MKTTSDPVQFDLGRWRTHLFRGIRRRCANCGGGGLFRRWLVMERSCPRCHLILDRNEPDYFLGSYVINFVTAEFVIALGTLGSVLYSWPDVPWNGIKWTLLLLMVPVPVLFYPFAKTLWLAIDLSLRPPTWADFAGHGENETPPVAAPSTA
ncbi:DUF983 domain-containing protein [Gemmatimonadota bacterium DH-20]|uniref:DUF983 domain-containing protein n=1 Tax=Gaopeijia maritima TaxID=3119007 RepID=A0ABU9EDR5_9BACT